MVLIIINLYLFKFLVLINLILFWLLGLWYLMIGFLFNIFCFWVWMWVSWMMGMGVINNGGLEFFYEVDIELSCWDCMEFFFFDWDKRLRLYCYIFGMIFLGYGFVVFWEYILGFVCFICVCGGCCNEGNNVIFIWCCFILVSLVFVIVFDWWCNWLNLGIFFIVYLW